MSKGAKRPPGGGGHGSGRGTGGLRGRNVKQKLRTARGRKLSSTRWLRRQLSDPYVAEAGRLGYRSRAAFKLIQMDERYGLLRPGARVVDLGAAPGGWTQVAVERVGERGRVVGLDVSEMEPVAGAEILRGDFLEEDCLERLTVLLGGAPGEGVADAVLSDMAAPATGHRPTDHLRIVALAEAALDFAEAVLAPGGCFVAKVLQGGSEPELLKRLRLSFRRVHHVKPLASRADSAELYVVATGFRGRPEAEAAGPEG
ncbi:MAG: RlmE family RNA methyltransferase [Kiloniellales bacterium]|nr:RlmE family RNA methyltransferase [Kiloniellales bacterium]